MPIPLPTAPLDSQRHAAAHRYESEDDEMWGLPDSIKLGLGDFIFYSVLVGRAAMYDMLTVFAAYLAIVAGLGTSTACLTMTAYSACMKYTDLCGNWSGVCTESCCPTGEKSRLKAA